MNGEEGSRHSARALRNIARVDYKSLHRGKSQKCKIMSSIEEEPKSDALMGDMSSLDGASGGLGDSLHAKRMGLLLMCISSEIIFVYK